MSAKREARGGRRVAVKHSRRVDGVARAAASPSNQKAACDLGVRPQPRPPALDARVLGGTSVPVEPSRSGVVVDAFVTAFLITSVNVGASGEATVASPEVSAASCGAAAGTPVW